MKKMLMRVPILLLILGAFILSSCSIRLADLSVVATHNVNLDKVDLDSKPQTKGIRGRDSAFVFLFIPFGIPHLEEAIDDALTKGNGDVLLDAVIYSKSWWFLIGENALEVKGTVVKTRNN